jgi:GT2 family glycosyltransferase
VTVVDNASTDGSLEHLREHWPAVRLLALPENEGFPRAANRGMQAATTEYVASLNEDMRVDPDWLGELVAALDSHPEAASAGGKLLNARRPELLDGAGDFMSWGGACRRGHGEPERGQYDRPEEAFSACGGAALYRRSALEAVGLLDERFHMYLDDVDWGFRARLAGYTCRYVPTAVAHHVGGATTARWSDFEPFYLQRNSILLAAKNFPARSLLRHGHRVLIQQVRMILPAPRLRRARIALRAWCSAAGALPGALRQRRRIQRGRRLSTAELESLIL